MSAQSPQIALEGMRRYDFAKACLYLRSELNYRPEIEAVCVLGVFDGVHRGHQSLIKAACQDAHRRKLPCIVVSFCPDPADVVFEPQSLSHLLRQEDRLALLASCGVDGILCLDFTFELATTSWQDFLSCTLWAYLRPHSLHVGQNFHFGCGGKGGIPELKRLAPELGFELFDHELMQIADVVVSATHIRELLRQGQVEQAGNLLGRQHFVRGTVQHGRGEGNSFGFPTANVQLDRMDCVPAQGVYAGWVVMDCSAWPAAINVGLPPSFNDGDTPSFLEANLIGFTGDLYGADLAVSFASWLRASRKFDSLDELEQTVLDNIDWVKNHLAAKRIELARGGIYNLKVLERKLWRGGLHD